MGNVSKKSALLKAWVIGWLGAWSATVLSPFVKRVACIRTCHYKKIDMFCWWDSHMSAERCWESVLVSLCRSLVLITGRTSRRRSCLFSCSLLSKEALGNSKRDFLFCQLGGGSAVKVLSAECQSEICMDLLCGSLSRCCLICKADRGRPYSVKATSLSNL